jgi:ATP-dependent Lon protease
MVFQYKDCLHVTTSIIRRLKDSFERKWYSAEEYYRVNERIELYLHRLLVHIDNADIENVVEELQTMLQDECEQYGIMTMADYAVLYNIEEMDELLKYFFVPLGGRNTNCSYPFYVKEIQVPSGRDGKSHTVMGYFEHIPSIKLLQVSEYLMNKFTMWSVRLRELNFDIDIVDLYLSAIDLFDLYEKDFENFVESLECMIEKLHRLRERCLSDLMTEFIQSTQLLRYEILKVLLMGTQEDQFVAHILHDMLLNPTNSADCQLVEQGRELYHSLPYTLQKVLKILHRKMEKKTQDTNSFLAITEDQVSYDKRISALRVPYETKTKICEKLREMKGSRESSAKAQQYLDGILKIPFGVYRQEPIFHFFTQFRRRVGRGIEQMRQELRYWKPTIENGDTWFYHRWMGILDAWTRESEHWTENKIEQQFQEVLSYIDDTIQALTPSQSPVVRECEDEEEGNKAENEVIQLKAELEEMGWKPVPQDIYDRLLSWEQLWKSWIEEWHQFSVRKSEYLQTVRQVLSECVFGHEETKLQIERLLAQWIHGKMDGMVFGFQGPPGVGKTTLAKKGFASCFQDEKNTPRPIGFLPLGGASNGSYLYGHHYTYLGSTWGRIVDILMESKCMNPIIYIDELDKVSQTEQGKEIIGILTHITDKSHNQEFYDRYFAGIPIDLSKVIFVFSYNDANAIDKILRDRITEVHVQPLNMHEKTKIIQDYSLKEILNAVGYQEGDIEVSRDVLENLIQEYTQEAGVRKLHERIYEIVREVNLRRMLDPGSFELPLRITWEWVQQFYQDRPKIHSAKIPEEPMVGLVNGLYATVSGVGGLSVIQCVKTPSEKKLHLELTGQQGNIMKESMLCAKTLSWNLLTQQQKRVLQEEWEICGAYGLHVHCPEAATPKDGPSAGCAITVAMVSRLANVPVRHDVAMTGEIDLHGNVHPVGGIETKLHGAYRAGVREVFLPDKNREDVVRLLNKYKKQEQEPEVFRWFQELMIHYVSKIEEVLARVLIVREDM